MKKQTIAILLIVFTTGALAQIINRTDFNQRLKQIGNTLPKTWTVTSDTAFPNEIIVYSAPIALKGNNTSNDPPYLKGECQIYIKMVSRISPDSIQSYRNKNKTLLEQLPPQNSKDNLKDWYNKNGEVLKILDAEPTHYDKNYSYRIKCYRTPDRKSTRLNSSH